MNAVPILLLIGALFLLMVEVLIVSFGLITLLAIGCAVGGVLLAFQESSAYGWSLIGVAVVGGPLAVRGAFLILPKLPFARGFYLQAPELTEADRRAADRTDRALLGREGVATSPLRPSGSALFGDEPRDVVTKGVMVARGARVRVVDVSGNRIIVEPIESGTAQSA